MGSLSTRIEVLESRRMLSAAVSAGGEHALAGGPDLLVPLATAPKPTDGGLSLTEVANTKFRTKLGEFQFKTIDEQLTAQINWGDGFHSLGTLDGSYATGEYYVKGTHTYLHPGTFAVQVKIFAAPIGSPIHSTTPVAQFTSVITATPLRPSEGGKTLHETAGQKFTTKLGEFNFKSIDLALVPVINWGDGTTSDGTLIGAYNNGTYYVQGTHTYAKDGTYKITVKIFTHLVGNPTLSQSPIARFTSVAIVKPAA